MKPTALHSSDPGPMTGAPEPADRGTLSPSLAPERALLTAWAVSAILHAMVMAAVYIVGAATPHNEIRFDPSVGVALMGRIGYAPPLEEPIDSEELEVPPEPAPAEEMPQEVAQIETLDQPVDEEPAEDPSDWELIDHAIDPEEIARVAAVTRREAERQRINLRPAIAPARPEPSEGASDMPPDPAELPPSERYPEGTLNPIATDVAMWGPEGARSVAVVRNDRIRGSVHRDAVETIFGGLQDWSSLRTEALNPLDDVDAMLLASTDPRYVSRTFIAALHHVSAEHIVRELGSGYPGGVSWEERDGRIFGTPRRASAADPRVFLIPTEGLFIFSRPEYLEALMDNAPPPRGIDGAFVAGDDETPLPTIEELLGAAGVGPEPEAYDPGQSPCSDRRGIGRRRCRTRIAERREASERERAAWQRAYDDALEAAEAERARLLAERMQEVRIRRRRPDRRPPIRDDGWMHGLLEIGDLGGTGDDGPAITWTYTGFSTFALDGQGDAPPPLTLHASMTMDRDPVFRARLVFESEDAARAFHRRVDDIVSANMAQLAAIGLLGSLRDGDWKVDHDELTLDTTIPGSTITRIATMIALTRAGQ